MKEEEIISLEEITKVFKLPHEKLSTVKQHFVNIFNPKTYERFTVLDKVSFDIKKGEFFGIIGSNGSGKSTLLKILAGIYHPTSGKVIIKGNVSPFIELGVGFNPELTARENIFLNAAILGLSKKQTEEKFDAIINFAELEAFLDQKLKNFSSGMQVRLAFSIAIQAESEILVIDEVLAVGDANFQQKCFEIFRKLKKEGKTIVYVSHDLNSIKDFCDRVAYINKGKLISIGKPRNVLNDYLDQITEKRERILKSESQKKEERWGDQKATIEELWVEQDGKSTNVVTLGQFRILAKALFIKDIEDPVFGLVIRDSLNRDVVVSNTKIEMVKTGLFKKGQTILIEYELNNDLEDGKYSISPAIAESKAEKFHDWRNDFKTFISRKDRYTGGVIDQQVKISIKNTGGKK